MKLHIVLLLDFRLTVLFGFDEDLTRTIVIPSTYVDVCVFAGFSNLKEINIPPLVTSISSLRYRSKISGLGGLEKITISCSYNVLSSCDNGLFEDCPNDLKIYIDSSSIVDKIYEGDEKMGQILKRC